MSLINDALKRTEDAKLDKLAEAELVPEMPTATYGKSNRKRLLGPLALVCLLLGGGGFVAYQYGYLGGGPGLQTATADSKTPALPGVVPTPAKPKVDQEIEKWVNPAFKNLTPEAANAMRQQVARAMVQQFFEAGSSLNELASSASAPRPKRAKPPVKVAANQSPKPAVAKPKAPADPPPAKPKPAPKPKGIQSAAAAGVDPSAFNVSGIMYNGADSMAVINQGVYRVGQKVSGAIVDSITPTAVILRVGDKRFRVGM